MERFGFDGFDASGVVIKTVSLSMEIGDFLNLAKKSGGRGEVVQLFDPDAIIGRGHILYAYLNSLLAFREGSNRSKSVGLEMLLFAAMTRQISEAIKRVGAKTKDDVLLFATRSSYTYVKKYTRREEEFRPTKRHRAEAAARLGVLTGTRLDTAMLNRMSSIRLDA